MRASRPNHLVAFILVVGSLVLLAGTQVARSQPADPGMAAMTAPAAPPAMTAPMAAPMAPPPEGMTAVPASMTAPMTPAVPVAAMEPPVPAMTAGAVLPDAAAPAASAAAAEPLESVDHDLAAPQPVVAATPVRAEPATSKPAVKVEKQDNWWQTTLGGVIQIVLLLVAGIAAPIGVLLVRLIAKKAKITDTEQQHIMEGLVTNAISIGINYATQMSNKLNNSPDAKSQRIKWATDKAAEILKEYGIADKTGKWIADRIEAQLGLMNGPKDNGLGAGAGTGLDLGTEPAETAGFPELVGKTLQAVIDAEVPKSESEVTETKSEEPKA
jgi:hypothetical protein